MSVISPPLELRTSPHIKSPVDTVAIMRNVVYALIPVCLFAVYSFGWSALLLILVTTAACVLSEHVVCLLTRKPTTVGDWSAVITGILLALTLPPGFPLWMAVVGAVFAIVVGKLLFGGLGYNTFNPALIGRAFLQATFPAAITTWSPAFDPHRFLACLPSTLTAPFMRPLPAYFGADAFSGATPLASWKFEHTINATTSSLFLGTTAGSAGETSALLILIGGIYLISRRMMDWRIPAGIFVSTAVVSGAFWFSNMDKYPSPIFMLFSGGLMLGAVFMATDMVGSPVTPLGVWIYGALIGAVTVIIRLMGGLPEGMMYAILLGNALTPLIDPLTQPRVFGARKTESKK